MSSYTIKLKEIVDLYADPTKTVTADKIESARTKIFDFDYPIFDTNYKSVLETHFIRNFFMREIGFETEGLFKFYLETWMIINMPYYNKLFESELVTYDPLSNTHMDATHNKTNGRTQTGTSDSTENATGSGTQSSTATNSETGFQRDVVSDTPDTRLELTANNGQGVIEYASNIDEVSKTDNSNSTVNATTDNTNNRTGNTTINATINDTEDYIQHRTGKVGVQTYAKMIQEFRQSFLRIEKTMFQDMQDLFMLVY